MNMLNNKVLVKLLDQEEEALGGLIVVNKKSDVELAEVKSIPNGEAEIIIGDRILVAKDKLALTPHGHIVDRKDILAILD